jgi:Domain of unknown function (DUF2804), N-terminal/Domain of unknown function (DUF2804), C-terminal
MTPKPLVVIWLILIGLSFLVAGCSDDEDCDDSYSPEDTGDDDDASGDDDDDDSGGFEDPQVEITEPTLLINPDGSLNARGWARSPLMLYNPENIPPQLAWRVKIWDHYTIVTPRFAYTITIADIKYVTFMAFEVVDFETGEIVTGIKIVLGSKGTIPLSPMEDTEFRAGDTFMTIEYDQGVRTFNTHMDSSLLSPELDGAFTVSQNPNDEDVASAAPFSQDGYFFYENKILGMPTEGEVTVNGKTYVFDPEDSFAILDWGRGVWPHTHEWHWGSGAGYLDGGIVGFNVGDGWSKDELGTANVQKYHGVIHKIYYMEFDYDRNQMTKPWKMRSDDGKLRVDFVPFFHQKTGLMFADIGMLGEKMYGKYSGVMTLDDGTEVEFENLYGFIEHSSQKW